MFPLKDDNPTSGPTPLTIALIVICVLIFLFQIAEGQNETTFIYRFALIPGVLFGFEELPQSLASIPPVLTLFTSMFLHGGIMHLAGNILFLWIFGNNIEDSFGGLRFLFFYILCGLAASAAQIIHDPTSTIPMIGASGAISGVLGAYLRFFPRAQILTLVILVVFVTTIRIRAFWFLGLWFAIQALNGLNMPAGQGGVAWWAHIGGFVAGFALSFVFPRRHRHWPRQRPRGRAHRRGPWG